MDITLKAMEIPRVGKDGLICTDNTRADIKVSFFIRVNKTKDIKAIFRKQQKATGYGDHGLAPAIEQIEDISGSLRGIAESLRSR